ASALWLLGEPAAAQAPFPGGPPGSPPGYPGSRNPVCLRLEAQLVAIDRGNSDPARAAEIKRLEDQASRQQIDVDRVAAQARRLLRNSVRTWARHHPGRHAPRRHGRHLSYAVRADLRRLLLPDLVFDPAATFR